MVSETKLALRSIADGKAIRPDKLYAELLKLGLTESFHESLLAFHRITVAVWITGEVPQMWKDAIIRVLHMKKDRTECGNSRSLSLGAPAGKILLKCVANQLGNFCEEAGILPEEQRVFRPQRSTIDMMIVVHGLHNLGRTNNTCLKICFTVLAHVYNSVNCVLLLDVLARCGLHVIHDGKRARAQLDDGFFSTWLNVGQGFRQECVLSPLCFHTFGVIS